MVIIRYLSSLSRIPCQPVQSKAYILLILDWYFSLYSYSTPLADRYGNTDNNTIADTAGNPCAGNGSILNTDLICSLSINDGSIDILRL